MRPADRYQLLAQVQTVRQGGYVWPCAFLADVLAEYLWAYERAQDRLAGDIWLSMRCFGRPDIVPCKFPSNI